MHNMYVIEDEEESRQRMKCTRYMVEGAITAGDVHEEPIKSLRTKD